MANLKTLDGDGSAAYISASGAGTDLDPHVVNQSVGLTGNLPDTAAGDLAAIVAALGAALTVDGSGVTQPVSGTVTANLSATDNAVLDAIVTALADPATQTTLAAVLADTAAMDTNLATVAGAISGTEMQVDVVAALPAGTNAIGKLSANSGVDIGDVDVTSIAAGENVIGLVGASDTVVTVTCSLPTGALTAGDVMFDTQEIAAAARTSGGTVILQSVTVLDKDDQGAEFDLVFLDASTSLGTEDAAVSITDANAEDILGTVNVATTDYCDLVGSQVATVSGIGLEMATSASTSLYVAGITRGTPTYTAAGVIIKFAFLRS